MSLAILVAGWLGSLLLFAILQRPLTNHIGWYAAIGSWLVTPTIVVYGFLGGMFSIWPLLLSAPFQFERAIRNPEFSSSSSAYLEAIGGLTLFVFVPFLIGWGFLFLVLNRFNGKQGLFRSFLMGSASSICLSILLLGYARIALW